MSSTEAAYLAAIIDGEGTITVSRKKDHKGMRGGFAYRPYVGVCNTNLLLLEWCMRTTGVGSIKRKSRPIAGRKQGYAWHLWSQKAGAVVRQIRPFLVIKGRQADLLTRMVAAKRDGVGRNGLTTEERQFQIDTYEALKVLNKRGA